MEETKEESYFFKLSNYTDKIINLYKENPENYRGNVADISNILRIALTTKTTTPDLYEIMKLLGKERIKQRFSKICG